MRKMGENHLTTAVKKRRTSTPQDKEQPMTDMETMTRRKLSIPHFHRNRCTWCAAFAIILVLIIFVMNNFRMYGLAVSGLGWIYGSSRIRTERDTVVDVWDRNADQQGTNLLVDEDVDVSNTEGFMEYIATSATDMGEFVKSWCDCSEGNQRPKLYMKDKGTRMGNVLFQMATLYGLARQTNHTPVMLVRGTERLAALLELKRFLPNFFLCLQLDVVQVPVIDVPKFATFDSTLLPSIPHKSVALNGYFQSWRYFLPCENELKFMLRWESGYVKYSQRKLHSIRSHLPEHSPDVVEPIFIGLHVRRFGLDFPLNVKIGYKLADVNYITHAMDHFRLKYPTSHFVVCSDDIEWCRQNIGGHDVHFPSKSDSSAIEDLALLSQCNHTIMTVGTFGWWAAYMAGGEAVYYKDMYTPGSKMDRGTNTDDFLLPDWKALV